MMFGTGVFGFIAGLAPAAGVVVAAGVPDILKECNHNQVDYSKKLIQNQFRIKEKKNEMVRTKNKSV